MRYRASILGRPDTRYALEHKGEVLVRVTRNARGEEFYSGPSKPNRFYHKPGLYRIRVTLKDRTQ